MNRKNIKRNALLTSIISLLLCVSMLVGTTFAWFTDEVKSGRNTIAAGNLDIELLANGNKVDENTVLFNNEQKWEPGVVVYENLQVVNVGTLALKYQMTLNVVAENNLNGHKLSEVVKVAILEQPVVKDPAKTPAEQRAEVLAAAKASTMVCALSEFCLNGTLEAGVPGNEQAIVIFWEPNDNAIDNLYNANNEQETSDKQPLFIEFGVNLQATQKMSENDSFGNDYDENAWANAMKVSTPQELKAAIESVEDGGIIAVQADLTFDANTNTHNSGTWYDGLYYVGDKSFTIDLGGKTITADSSVNDYLLNFKNDGQKANTITLKNGTLEAASTAFCALCTSSTSTQKITINLENVALVGNNSGGSVAKIRGGAELNVKAGTVITGNDSYAGIECVASTVNVFDGAKIYQNGTSSYLGGLVGVCAGGEVNVYGGTGTSAKCGFVAMTSGGTINVSGGEWIANTDGSVGNNSNLYVLTSQNNSYETGYVGASIINVTGGTFRGGMDAWILNTDRGEVAELNISGGNFNANPATYVADGFSAVENANGTFVVMKGNYTEAVADGVYKSDKGYGITTAAGFNWIDAQADTAFAGKTITLEADIDFGGATVSSPRLFTPENRTVIDGNGKTLSNFVINNTDGNAGLFNGTVDIKNLTVDKATVTGKYAGILAGNLYGNIDNCTVKNSTVNGSYWQTGMLCGQYNAGSITNCTVDNCTINGLSAVGALVGILNESSGTRVIENCTVTNCTINQTGSFGGSYDNYFGVVVGLINTKNATIEFNNNTIENNTLKGAASDVLFGEADPSNTITVNGTVVS